MVPTHVCKIIVNTPAPATKITHKQTQQFPACQLVPIFAKMRWPTSELTWRNSHPQKESCQCSPQQSPTPISAKTYKRSQFGNLPKLRQPLHKQRCSITIFRYVSSYRVWIKLHVHTIILFAQNSWRADFAATIWQRADVWHCLTSSIETQVQNACRGKNKVCKQIIPQIRIYWDSLKCTVNIYIYIHIIPKSSKNESPEFPAFQYISNGGYPIPTRFLKGNRSSPKQTEMKPGHLSSS